MIGGNGACMGKAAKIGKAALRASRGRELEAGKEKAPCGALASVVTSRRKHFAKHKNHPHHASGSHSRLVCEQVTDEFRLGC